MVASMGLGGVEDSGRQSLRTVCFGRDSAFSCFNVGVQFVRPVIGARDIQVTVLCFTESVDVLWLHSVHPKRLPTDCHDPS